MMHNQWQKHFLPKSCKYKQKEEKKNSKEYNTNGPSARDEENK